MKTSKIALLYLLASWACPETRAAQLTDRGAGHRVSKFPNPNGDPEKKERRRDLQGSMSMMVTSDSEFASKGNKRRLQLQHGRNIQAESLSMVTTGIEDHSLEAAAIELTPASAVASASRSKGGKKRRMTTQFQKRRNMQDMEGSMSMPMGAAAPLDFLWVDDGESLSMETEAVADNEAYSTIEATTIDDITTEATEAGNEQDSKDDGQEVTWTLNPLAQFTFDMEKASLIEAATSGDDSKAMGSKSAKSAKGAKNRRARRRNMQVEKSMSMSETFDWVEDNGQSLSLPMQLSVQTDDVSTTEATEAAEPSTEATTTEPATTEATTTEATTTEATTTSTTEAAKESSIDQALAQNALDISTSAIQTVESGNMPASKESRSAQKRRTGTKGAKNRRRTRIVNEFGR